MFYRPGGYRDSEGSSSSDDDIPEVPTKQKVVYESSDSDEDEKRFARSNRDKRLDEIRSLSHSINNHKKIQDMQNVLKDFESLCKAYERVIKAINVDKEGIPPLFIRCLAELEEFINICWDKKKAMSKINAKHLATLRQKIKRYNRDFEQQILDFKENPDKYEDHEVQEEKEDVVKDKPVKNKAAKKLESSDEFEWDSSSSSSETSSSDDDKYKADPAARFIKKPESEKVKNKEKRKEKVVSRPSTKSAAAAGSDDSDDSDFETAGFKNKARDETSTSASTAGFGLVSRRRTVSSAKELLLACFEKESAADISAESILTKLHEIMSSRGRRKTDRKDQVALLAEMMRMLRDAEFHPSVSNNYALQAKTGFCLLAVLFDSCNPAFPMKMDIWKRLAAEMSRLLSLLERHQATLRVDLRIDDEQECILVAGADHCYCIKACILTMVERLDDEYTHILQNTDAHANEYVERLQEEASICALIERICVYLDRVEQSCVEAAAVRESTLAHQIGAQRREGDGGEEEAGEEPADDEDVRYLVDMKCRAYIRRVDHLYYKYDHEWARSHQLTNEERAELPVDDEDHPEANWASCACSAPPTTPRGLHEAESTRLMSFLCTYIAQKDAYDRLRTRAILYLIYFLALHDDWNLAKQYLLMSNLQSKIDLADISIKIFFNRIMVQLGLCAFRRGQIREAHQALTEMLSVNRVRELLAQGVSSQQQRNQLNPEKSAELERQERRRMMPYHMYINMEVIECVYHVSAMFIETPYLATNDVDMRRRHISKHFHRALKQSESNNLNGPPESMRDHIVAATKAIRYGEWERAYTALVNEKMNAKVWDLFNHPQRIKAMLHRMVREQTLRCYLISYSTIYDSISLPRLAEAFQLSLPVVNTIVCKLINREPKEEYCIKGSLDEPTQSLVMHRGEPARVHSYCLQIADKLAALHENVEKFADLKMSGMPGPGAGGASIGAGAGGGGGPMGVAGGYSSIFSASRSAISNRG